MADANTAPVTGVGGDEAAPMTQLPNEGGIGATSSAGVPAPTVLAMVPPAQEATNGSNNPNAAAATTNSMTGAMNPNASMTEEDPQQQQQQQQSRPKADKAEPLNILVRDQTGAGLQFKVMAAFCQKKSYQMSQVRFLYDGERIHKHQTPQSVDMEEGDVIDCVIEQLGGGGGDNDGAYF